MRIGLSRSRAPSRAASVTRLPLFMSRLCKLDDQDGVLCRKADEHDEADLGIDVVHLAAEPDCGKGAEDRDGRAEEHAERQRPALILGRKDEKDAEQRKPEDGQGRYTFLGLLFLEAHADVIEAHLPRHRLVEDFFEGLHRLGGAEAGLARGVNLGRAVEVVAHREFGPERDSMVVTAESGTGSPLSLCTIELADILGLGAVFSLRLDIDLPLPAEAVEVVDEVAAHEGLKRLIDLSEIDALLEHLVPVHVDEELGHRGRKVVVTRPARASSARLRGICSRSPRGK